MKKRRKIFTSRLSFDKDELRNATLSMFGGVSMPMYKTEKELYAQFGLEKKSLASFGMFGNSPAFYPEVGSAQDIVPKEEDFIRVPFRLISATIVGGGTWKATDFSNAAVLKKSTKMLEGKPLYKDHETDIDNWVGFVEGVKWSESSVDTAAKVNVPAGIDGIVVVDAKTNPKVARGLLMGTIFSNSVTVEFNWEMSHEFENEYDFQRNIGTLGKDGKMVRRVVTQVNAYHESSLVWLGADPFAKMIEQDGTLRQIDVTGIVEYDKETDRIKDLYEKSKKFAVGYEFSKDVVSLTKRSEEKKQVEQQNKEENMDKITLAIIAMFGLAKDTKLTEDEIVAYLAKVTPTEGEAYTGLTKRAGAFDKLSKVTLQAEAEKFETVELSADEVEAVSDKATAKFGGKEVVIVTESFVKGLNDRIADLTPLAKIGEENLKLKRAEIVRLYKVAVGEKADDAVIETFEKADAKALDGLLAQYTKGATAKFTATCKTCQGTEVEFRSTVAESKEATETEKAVEQFVVTSNDFYTKFGNKPIH